MYYYFVCCWGRIQTHRHDLRDTAHTMLNISPICDKEYMIPNSFPNRLEPFTWLSGAEGDRVISSLARGARKERASWTLVVSVSVGIGAGLFCSPSMWVYVCLQKFPLVTHWSSCKTGRLRVGKWRQCCGFRCNSWENYLCVEKIN